MLNGVSWRVRRPVVLTAVIAAGVLAASGGTAYAVTSALSGPSQPSGTVYACVASGGKLASLESGKVPYACPKGDSLWKWAVIGPAGRKGATGARGATGATGPAGPQGPPGTYTPVTATADSNATDISMYGNHGTWADADFTASATVVMHGAVQTYHCGGTATNGITSCYFYTGTLSLVGSFQTTDGADSPNAGTAINGTVDGTLSGSSDYQFYATSDDPSAANVPATFSDASVNPADNGWPEYFFPEGTNFGAMSQPTWSVAYNAPATCESWVDAYNNSNGTADGAGDIAGVNACNT